MTISDLIAQFFAEREFTHCFTVSGAGNIRILDAIRRLGKTKIICTHGEQAAAQAAIGYYRASDRVAPVIVTCGGGAANVVTGIVSAWMDSIPLFVIAGQESRRNDKLRAYGVQGFDLSKMVAGVTKDAGLLQTTLCAKPILHGLYKYAIETHPALDRRFGPVVLEIPMDVQGAEV